MTTLVMPELPVLDKHLDAVLRASGSALKHYVPYTQIDMRKAMRDALEDFYRLGVESGRKERDDDTMDMALCESRKLVLRIGRRYRFYPVGDCATCAAMKAEHDEAYGAAPPAQEDKL